MSGLGKRGAGGGVVGSLQGVLGGERVFSADMLGVPNAGWPVSADAPLVVETQSATGTAREFESDVDRAVTFSLRVPTGAATKVLFRIPGRIGASPPAESQVLLRVYARVGEGAWSGPLALALMKLPNNMPQSTCVSALLTTLGLAAGDNAQFLVVRAPGAASDTLVGRWLLYELGVNFE